MYLSLLLLLCDSDVCKVMCLLDDVDLKVIGNWLCETISMCLLYIMLQNPMI